RRAHGASGPGRCRGSAAATAPTATVAATVAPATPVGRRAEVPERLGGFGVEGVGERHHLDVVGGSGVVTAVPRVTTVPAATTATVRRAVAAVTTVVATGLFVGGHQRHLAVGVDVFHPHLDLLAQGQLVLDLVDPTAAPDLGDVQQAVTPGQDVDERPELG